MKMILTEGDRGLGVIATGPVLVRDEPAGEVGPRV